MRIRRFDYDEDLGEVLSFLPELYESNFPGFVADTAFLARKRAQLREAVRDPGQAVLVAEDSVGICGFAWLVVEVEYQGRRRGEVVALHVARRVRRQGVGRRLLQEAEALLRAYGCDVIHLMVTASNEAAVGLYQSQGFHVTRYQMEKELKQPPRR